jgi:hypothetical protein
MGNVNILQNHFWKDCPVYKGFSKEIEKMEQTTVIEFNFTWRKSNNINF